MSSDKEYVRRYNPLELPVDEYGSYIQRMPLCTFEALDAQFPNEYIVVKVLYRLVKLADNLTYLSGTEIIQEVEISTTELANAVNADQPNVYEAIVKLQAQNWIQNKNKKQRTKGKYIVNFNKVIDAIRDYRISQKSNKTHRRKMKNEDVGKPPKELTKGQKWW